MGHVYEIINPSDEAYLAQRLAVSSLGAQLSGGSSILLSNWENKIFDAADRLVAEAERRETDARMSATARAVVGNRRADAVDK